MTTSSKKEVCVGYCGGRECPTCHKCRDWYCNSQDHTYDCDASKTAYMHHLGPLVGPLHRWRRRFGATCGFRSYPHYVYYAAYHGQCPYNNCIPIHPVGHNHTYPKPAIHGPHICHCEPEDSTLNMY